MSVLSLKKFGRLYIWIILLILAIAAFILLRSPTAGQQQAQQRQGTDGTTSIYKEPPSFHLEEEQQAASSDQGSVGQTVIPVTPSPTPTPTPTPTPQPVYEPRNPIFCPDSRFSSGCSPCEPSTWPWRNMVCYVYDEPVYAQ